MMVVKDIVKDSLAARSGFEVGDKVLRINDCDINDLLDFQAGVSERFLLLEIERGGQVYEVEVERVDGEPFGLVFEDMRLRRCNNKCVFCFIHQMPRGMRRSLYFEDDDYRLSFLHGSYVTLTNVRDKDIERIVEQGLSPQYISVHATDPAVRQAILGRRRPTVDIVQRLRQLAAGGIEMHAQVVLCPGWNDGPHLQRTIEDLGALYPAVRSVALVPVGLTKFRHNLPRLRPVDAALARHYLEQARQWGERFGRQWGERFVYAADELFLLSGAELPPIEYYDAFPQLENGIGMVRSFLQKWEQGKRRLPRRLPEPVRMGWVTGTLAASFMAPIAAEVAAIEGVEVELLVVANDFFGRGIGVSGLLTGADIARRLRREGGLDVAFLPPNCINGEGLTLDDMDVGQLEAAAGVPLAVGDYDMALTLEAFFARRQKARRGRGRQLSELGYFAGRRR